MYVTDIAETVSMILARASMSNHAPLAEEMGGPCLPLGFSRLFNLGGPQRLSRLEMASIVARTFSYSDEALVPSTSGAVDRYAAASLFSAVALFAAALATFDLPVPLFA